MSEHPNVERMRQGYEAFGKGDLEALRRLWTDDIRWHETGRSDLAGTYEGADAIFRFFGRLMDLTEGSLRVEPPALLADDHYGAAPDRHRPPRRPAPRGAERAPQSASRTVWSPSSGTPPPTRTPRPVPRLSVPAAGSPAQPSAGASGRTTTPSASAHSHSPSRKTTPAKTTVRPT